MSKRLLTLEVETDHPELAAVIEALDSIRSLGGISIREEFANV